MTPEKPRFPLLLAHGLGVTARGGPYHPWGRIPALLRAQGLRVELGEQDAWGSIETGAAQLAEAVERLHRQCGTRVHVIAHSKGGLEARHLISGMGYADAVASLTMLSTPNRGSRVAEQLLCVRPGIAAWARGNDAWWRRHGDRAPDTLLAGEQLTPAYLEGFNRTHPDAENVYYQSWGARLGAHGADPAMQLTHGLFFASHGDRDSDGLVTPDSARWGNFRGVLEGVSHQQLVDAAGADHSGFDVCAFYLRLVQELAALETGPA